MRQTGTLRRRMTMKSKIQPLELWGGIECTVNRVGNRYFDQLALSGHDQRLSDLERISDLGIRTMRYPALWERAAPLHDGNYQWSWVDERLSILRRLGILPIVGLVHHGSGPAHTNLTDVSFATGLAEYAGKLIERFPWLDHFTPVNEPLTTARFSGLYGHWYPHACDPTLFVKALLNQCRATVLAMRAIRKHRPDARLVQTEDLGKTHSTPLLGYQADFENERRWLTFDLLCGRVGREHPLANYFDFIGVDDREWLWFLDNPCPPDVLGVNYYVTSERYLDERLEHYPSWTHGGNGRHVYADVEAVRATPGLAGLGQLLWEAWQRYGLPLAVTEAHLACTREEQLRWLAEIWRDAEGVRSQGADVRAVTVWSMLGCYDWDSLLTASRGHYESGAFDLRGTLPRPTALAEMAKNLASGQAPRHPVLAAPGWWRRPFRLYPALRPNQKEPSPASSNAQPLLILGKHGILASTLPHVCDVRGLAYRVLSRKDCDYMSCAGLMEMIHELRPWAIVNTTEYYRIDAAECERHRCFRENVWVPLILAETCRRRQLKLLTFSTDLVFDGAASCPYRESDKVNPLGVYGRSKIVAESKVLESFPDALVIRSGAFFGPWDYEHFLRRPVSVCVTKEALPPPTMYAFPRLTYPI